MLLYTRKGMMSCLIFQKKQKSGRIKELEEAFKEYPVEEEYHQGKIENVLQVAEESENNILFKIGIVDEEKKNNIRKNIQKFSKIKINQSSGITLL